MAEAVVEPESNLDEEKVECGYCFEYNGRLVTPKVLPCGHVCCLPCLKKDVKANNILKCTICRKVFNIAPDDLTAADKAEETSIFCQPCKRTEEFRRAIVYCQKCETKFCSEHQKSHDILLDHKLMTMEEYKTQYLKLIPRNCSEHPSQPLSFGCGNCHSVLCLHCLNQDNKCTDGGSHFPVGLDPLLKQLKDSVGKIHGKAKGRVAELETLMNFCKQALADHDKQTEKLTDQMHTTRKQQVLEIHQKYDALNEELLKLRQESRVEISTFMDIQLEAVRDELATLIAKIEADDSNTNVVDLVSTYGEIKTELDMKLQKEHPTLKTMKSEKSLIENGIHRSVELCIETQPRSLVITLDGVSETLTIPTALNHFKAVRFANTVYSICTSPDSKSCIVGSGQGAVAQIKDSFAVNESFGKLKETVNGLCVLRDVLYGLVYGSPWEIQSIDPKSGDCFGHKGPHQYPEGNFLKIISSQNQLIAPKPDAKKLSVYDTNCQFKRDISIPTLTNNHIGMAAANDHLAVVTDSLKVYCVDLIDGKVLWTVSDIERPGGVTVYNDNLVLVADSKQHVVILDAVTGERVGLLTHTGDSGYIYDLCVWGDMLVITAGRAVNIYKLK